MVVLVGVGGCSRPLSGGTPLCSVVRLCATGLMVAMSPTLAVRLELLGIGYRGRWPFGFGVCVPPR